MALPPLPTPGISTGWGTTLNTYLDALRASLTEPAGIIKAFGGTVAPAGHAMCQGQIVNRTGTYANVFAAIGTNFGAGNGTTTFALPNLMGRVPVGMFNSGQINGVFDNMGELGGNQTHTLSWNEMPGHTHSAWTDAQGAHGHSVSQGTAAGVAAGGVGVVIDDVYHNQPTSVDGSHGHNVGVGNAGGGLAHNNLQPYIVVNFIITLG